jgi:hypothetical protein
VPALFQASELSAAARSRRSKVTMRSDGSSWRRSMPSVALMIPAPIRMTSHALVIARV